VADAKVGIVYIDVDWHRWVGGERTDEPEVGAVWDLTEHPEHPDSPVVREGFDSADEAVAWARERSPLVLVRLASNEDEFYSAGERQATRELAEHGGTDLRPYPAWPPQDYVARPS